MRDYGKVMSTFWTSGDIEGMSNTGKLLALYLLTGPHTNLIGCFRLSDGYVSDDLKWDAETVSKGFAELQDNGFATRDEGSKWVVIHNFLKHNEIENPNQGKSAARLFEQIPGKSVVKALLVNALEQYAPRFPTEVIEEFKRVSKGSRKGSRNQEQEQEQEQEQQQKQEQEPEQDSLIPPSAKSPRKKTGPSEPNPLNVETWKAYKGAYLLRYGVEPVRNAMVNAQIKSFVDRLGEEAPAVAAFYVSSNTAFYVRSKHGAGAMVKDAEGLRTEWATGRTVTQTQAMQADRTETNLSAFAPLIAEARERERNDVQRETA